MDGWVTVDVIYPGESTRDSKFPKLKTGGSSYFLNIALKANNYSYEQSRFAYELYIIGPGKEGFTTTKTRFIDDQYTPGKYHQRFVHKKKNNTIFLQVVSMFGNCIHINSQYILHLCYGNLLFI